MLLTHNAAAQQPNAPTPLFPKALSPGDTILLIAPAKYLDRERVALCKKRLEAMGFRVRHSDTLFRRHGFLGGTDEERAAEINAAFADPNIDAIFPGTGGYGTTRIVDRLDYDTIRKNPKILVGFSDITGLHTAINQRTGLITFHSPNPEYGLGTKDNLSPFAAQHFWRALLATNYDRSHPGYTISLEDHLPTRQLPPGEPASPGLSLPKSAGGISGANATGATDKNSSPTTTPTPHSSFDIRDSSFSIPRPITLVPGRAQGRLIGGNLSVLHALMGTPYEIETDGKIFFLEDVGEAPYRVDRMLSTLRLAGKFDHVAGIILGAFTSREDETPWDTDATVDDVLRDYFAELDVPVLMHFPVGHVRYNATLPIGAQAELDATNQTLRLLENPIALEAARVPGVEVPPSPQ